MVADGELVAGPVGAHGGGAEKEGARGAQHSGKQSLSRFVFVVVAAVAAVVAGGQAVGAVALRRMHFLWEKRVCGK